MAKERTMENTHNNELSSFTTPEGGTEEKRVNDSQQFEEERVQNSENAIPEKEEGSAKSKAVEEDEIEESQSGDSKSWAVPVTVILSLMLVGSGIALFFILKKFWAVKKLLD